MGQAAERRREGGGGPEIVSGFPRGLPDGNLHRPLATARWPSEGETLAMLGEWKPGRFLIGRNSAGRYIGHSDDRHILTVAGSRAGKGISLIVPALLTWPHSAICIDPKGELATITASRRGRGSPKKANFFKALILVHNSSMLRRIYGWEPCAVRAAGK